MRLTPMNPGSTSQKRKLSSKFSHLILLIIWPFSFVIHLSFICHIILDLVFPCFRNLLWIAIGLALIVVAVYLVVRLYAMWKRKKEARRWPYERLEEQERIISSSTPTMEPTLFRSAPIPVSSPRLTPFPRPRHRFIRDDEDALEVRRSVFH